MTTRERIRSIDAELRKRLGIRVAEEVVRELALDIHQAISDAASIDDGVERGVQTFMGAAE